MSAIHPTVKIHPSSVVDAGAQIGEGTEIGPFCVIGPHVVLGKRNVVRSHAVIEGHTLLGDDNQVFQFASIGATPQHLKYHGEKTELLVGNGNIIREYVTMQPGTVQGTSRSIVADKNLFMAGAHVAHDAVVGSSNVFANYACLAGHVEIGNRVTLGGLVGVHQFVRIGDMAILGAGSMVTKDIPPFCIAQGDRCHLIGINKIGLQRGGVSDEEVLQLRKLYRTLFMVAGTFAARRDEAKQLAAGNALALQLVEFVSVESSRGVTGPRSATRRDAGHSESAEP